MDGWHVLILTALLSGASSFAGAQGLRSLNDTDRANWKTARDAVLSHDGEWLVYREVPVAGNGSVTVVVRSTSSDVERRFPIGAAPGGLSLSASGRWLLFRVADAAASSSTDSSPEMGLQIVDLRGGQSRILPGVQTYALSGSEPEWLAMKRDGSAGATNIEMARLDTVLRSGSTSTLENVSEYAFDPTGSQIAWTTSDALYMRDLRSGVSKGPFRSDAPASFQNLSWSPGGGALAAMSRSAADGRYALFVITEANGRSPVAKALGSLTLKDFPANAEICPTPVHKGSPPAVNLAPLRWRDDERGLYFRVCAKTPPAPALGLAPNVSVWNWQDANLPGRRKQLAARNERPSFLSLLWLPEGRFVRLGNSDVTEIEPRFRGNYLLGYGWKSHGWQNESVILSSRATQLRDYVLIDLKSGKRRPLLTALPVIASEMGDLEPLGVRPQLSPDGAFFLYQRNGDYFAYEIATDRTRNLTAGLPTQFYYPENDPRTGFQGKQAQHIWPALQGWTIDSKAVLISDHFDVWLLPLDGSTAVNLTVDGRRTRTTYGRALVGTDWDLSSPPVRFPVDMKAPLYFRALDIDTFRTRLVRRMPDGNTQELRADDARMDFVRARSGKAQVYSRMTAVEPLDFYLADPAWKTVRRLTHFADQQKDIPWYPKPRYLTYKTPAGGILHATLYLPVGYEPGQRLPTVVQIYEYMSGSYHTYINRFSGFSSAVPWLERGYAVLWPDIVPRLGSPGPAALECVTAAVAAAVDTGAVDPNALGLFGHSYGAYETSYIISQTQLFKAAVAYAGMSDLAADYGSVYAGAFAKSQLYEKGQSALGPPVWENPELYLRNSPVFTASGIRTPLLMAHGDQDDAVSFSQSVSLFNALRRLGGKPVVLLEYAGENHDFSRKALQDFDRRQQEFFDHFLKGAPAPRWWSDGISYYAGEASGAGQ